MSVKSQEANDFSREPNRGPNREPGYRWRRDHEVPLQFVEPGMLIDQTGADSEALIVDVIREVDQLLRESGARRPVRVVVTLMLAGWTMPEIAARLGTTIYAVRRRLDAARALLLETGILDSAPLSPAGLTRSTPGRGFSAFAIHADNKPGRNRSRYYRRSPAPESGGVHRWAGPDSELRGKGSEQGSRGADWKISPRSRAPLYSLHPAPWTRRIGADGLRATLLVCPCCEARLRPLTPAQSFGWRQVYDSERHR